MAAKTRENVSVGRAASLAAGAGGLVAGYVHNAVGGPDLGGIGALVALRPAPGGGDLGSAAAADAVRQLGERLAMHVVAAGPRFLARDGVPADAVAAERALLEGQALKEQAEAKKTPPAHVLERMARRNSLRNGSSSV